MGAENKFKNSKPDSGSLKTNSTRNKEGHLSQLKIPGNLKENAKRLLTLGKKIRRILPGCKILRTNFKSKSKLTNDKPKKLKKLPTKTSRNTENYNTNLMRLKRELIWPNLLSTSFELKLGKLTKTFSSNRFVYQFFSDLLYCKLIFYLFETMPI